MKTVTDLKVFDALTDNDIEKAIARDPDAAPIHSTLKAGRRGLQKEQSKPIVITQQELDYLSSAECIERCMKGLIKLQVQASKARRK